jgi:multicomponent K+:H+ antiporter subunit G
MFWELLVCLLLMLGAAFALLGSVGLARFPDFYTRLHGPSKSITLGVGAIVIASAIHFSTQNEGISVREFLITMFLFITTPVSTHLVAKAAMHLRLRAVCKLPHLHQGGG